MTTYYVSSEIGSNKNAGTSATAPLATLQAASNLVKPGDTVQVMNGTYTAPGYGDALDITTSGTAAAPITFEAAPGQTPVINSSGGWQAINIKASYIVVSGFTVVGGAANYNLQSALAGYGTGNANLDGNGISVNTSTSVPLPNHITIENNTVYNEPGNGIDTIGADYVQILNNVVHNNANWSVYGNSGISVFTSKNLDTNAGPHIIISGNLAYDNAQLVPTNYSGIITDGEGIILDTNTGYTGGFLVQNNTVYGNGGPGVETFQTSNATITGNTIYGNNTGSVQAAANAQIFINYSTNITATNNTLTNNGGPPSAPVISKGAVNSNDSATLTGTAPNGAVVTVFDGGPALGTTTASTTGAWTFTTADLSAGAYAFTATDTTSGGTSAASTAMGVTVPAATGAVSPLLLLTRLKFCGRTRTVRPQSGK
jgi:parallel beta-helix repeat protein